MDMKEQLEMIFYEDLAEQIYQELQKTRLLENEVKIALNAATNQQQSRESQIRNSMALCDIISHIIGLDNELIPQILEVKRAHENMLTRNNTDILSKLYHIIRKLLKL